MKGEVAAGCRARHQGHCGFRKSCSGGEVGSDQKQVSGSDRKKQNHKMNQRDLLAWDRHHWRRMHLIARLAQGWSLRSAEAATPQTREGPVFGPEPAPAPLNGLNE